MSLMRRCIALAMTLAVPAVMMAAEKKDCAHCKGNGRCAKCHDGQITCEPCNGTGRVNHATRQGKTECAVCKGRGKKTCYACEGTGRCKKCNGTGKAS